MHQLKAVDHGGATAACTARVPRNEATVWRSEVTCPKCLTYLNVKRAVSTPGVKVLKRRSGG